MWGRANRSTPSRTRPSRARRSNIGASAASIDAHGSAWPIPPAGDEDRSSCPDGCGKSRACSSAWLANSQKTNQINIDSGSSLNHDLPPMPCCTCLAYLMQGRLIMDHFANQVAASRGVSCPSQHLMLHLHSPIGNHCDLLETRNQLALKPSTVSCDEPHFASDRHALLLIFDFEFACRYRLMPATTDLKHPELPGSQQDFLDQA